MLPAIDPAWFWPALMVLGLAVATWGLTLLRRSGRTPLAPGPAGSASPSASASASAILAERLARGEIDEAEYHARMRALHGE